MPVRVHSALPMLGGLTPRLPHSGQTSGRILPLALRLQQIKRHIATALTLCLRFLAVLISPPSPIRHFFYEPSPEIDQIGSLPTITRYSAERGLRQHHFRL